jgi:hypothetical protein
MKQIYKYTLFYFLVLVVSHQSYAQSQATEKLQKKYADAFSLFFYQNTLRMLNQANNKEFDELIKDIEKMKVLMINKSSSFTGAEYKRIKTDYTAESFEEVMSTRYQGRNFDVFLKEKSGKTQGMVVMVNDSSTFYVLDVVGRIALDKVTTLYSTLEQSTDIGKKIKSFTERNEKRKEDDKEGEDH